MVKQFKEVNAYILDGRTKGTVRIDVFTAKDECVENCTFWMFYPDHTPNAHIFLSLIYK